MKSYKARLANIEIHTTSYKYFKNKICTIQFVGGGGKIWNGLGSGI